eukprot:8925044-Ditylum_brightwellii.AAC.1
MSAKLLFVSSNVKVTSITRFFLVAFLGCKFLVLLLSSLLLALADLIAGLSGMDEFGRGLVLLDSSGQD